MAAMQQSGLPVTVLAGGVLDTARVGGSKALQVTELSSELAAVAAPASATCAVWNHSGKVLALGCDDGMVYLVSAGSFAVVATFPTEAVSACAVCGNRFNVTPPLLLSRLSHGCTSAAPAGS